ncbi:MAG: glycine--tRNA ligase subunit beta [Magnetospiraceae bacterium]
MADLLLELFSEEIPARMQARAAEDLRRLVTDGLKDAGLTFATAESYVTPRRLLLSVTDIPDAQPDRREEARGPRADAPQKAIDGFLKSKGLSLDDCEKRETPKGVFLFVVIEQKGRAAAEVLPALLEKAINDLPWPKSMRWGANEVRWVRPLRGILCLFGGAVVPISLGPVAAGAQTWGHRFMAPDAITVTGFTDYSEKLAAAKVMLDPHERSKVIARGAEACALREGLTVKHDDALLSEVTGLVEWPVVLMGAIDDAFMDVPEEVLTTAMRAHQKYFSLLDADGKMAPRFIVVANRESADNGAAIIAGNERVLRARLSDAKFFWDQDRAKTLESRLPRLEDIVFHAKIGTVAQKTAAVEDLAGRLAAVVPGADAAQVSRAAKLAKADLVSDMVFEFPELQGIMGRYYALNDGEPAAVADAIATHYSPQGPEDDCPRAPVSVAVALADKLYTLAGFWHIDEKPTGSKDPFALRRAALGVIRLILENQLRLPLREAFALAFAPFATDASDKIDSLLAFFADRLKVHLKEQGVRHDLISAVFALGDEDDLVRLLARVDALREFLDTEDGANLLVAYRRASNIVAIEEKKDGAPITGAPDPALFAEAAEKTLDTALSDTLAVTDATLSGEEFVKTMAALSSLREPVDAFFDSVIVNADNANVRANRLRLLSGIRSALGRVADFSKIEG